MGALQSLHTHYHRRRQDAAHYAILQKMDRKNFLKLGALGVSGLFVNKTFADGALASADTAKSKGIKFGVISDLHWDLMHDSERRANIFIDAMNKEQPDFIIQLGDFCVPKPENRKLLEIWDGFKGDKYHVLGNHDTDGGFTKAQALEFWSVEKPYYSFDEGGFHFVVLDGNEKSETEKISGYARTIGKQQLNWLKEDLKNTKLRTIICCHQAMDNTLGGLSNGMEVRYLLEQINEEAGFNKVILVLSGHHHLNYHNNINDIHYVQINSAGYYWTDDVPKKLPYSEEFYKSHGILRNTLIYEDPIWAVVDIDHKKNITIKGTESRMAGVPLEETGLNIHQDVYPITAKIDSRKLKY